MRNGIQLRKRQNSSAFKAHKTQFKTPKSTLRTQTTYKNRLAELGGGRADVFAGVREGHAGDLGSRVKAPSEAQHPANFPARFPARSPVSCSRRSREQRARGERGRGSGNGPSAAAPPGAEGPAEGPAEPPLPREVAAGSARGFRAPGPAREAQGLRRARSSLYLPA